MPQCVIGSPWIFMTMLLPWDVRLAALVAFRLGDTSSVLVPDLFLCLDAMEDKSTTNIVTLPTVPTPRLSKRRGLSLHPPHTQVSTGAQENLYTLNPPALTGASSSLVLPGRREDGRTGGRRDCVSSRYILYGTHHIWRKNGSYLNNGLMVCQWLRMKMSDL